MDSETPSGPSSIHPVDQPTVDLRIRPPERGQDPTLPRGVSLGRYVILNPLGGGGAGVVYAAYDPDLDRKVALKLLKTGSTDERAQTRLLREAQALARLNHPNVITVHDVDTFDGQAFVAMELVEGQTLKAWMARGPHRWREVVRIFLAAGRGLAAAHRAGLVHRDFKPDNVLLGEDGRVLVTDFGLARAAASAPEPAPSRPREERDDLPLPTTRSRSLEAAVTEEGTVVGTPAYMSPEQHKGEPADHRSDQFSFCIALAEALHGERPFAGSTHREIARRACRGEMREAQGGEVPTWLRRVVLRGLDPSPEERYPDMEALLADLAADPAATRRRRLRVAAVALAVVAAVALLFTLEARQSRMCAGAEAHLEGIWDASTQGVIQRAFLGTGQPFAAEAWEGIRRVLDRRARAWTEMHREACEATHVWGEQSDELLDRRMLCLAGKLEEQQALVEVFRNADPQVVTDAGEAVQGLSGLEPCADTEALMARFPLPRDQELRARIARLRTELAAARANRDAGRYSRALEIAEPLSRQAGELPYPPLAAESLGLLADLQRRHGDLEQAEDTLRRALWQAEEARDDELRAQVLIDLVYLVGYARARYEEGLLLGHHADSLLHRLGNPDRLAASLANHEALVQQELGHYPEALDLFHRAVALLERAEGQRAPRLAAYLDNLGNALARRGRYDEALLHHRRALDIRTEALGADHPEVARTLHSLGSLYFRQGRYEEAARRYQEAIDIATGALGRDNPQVVRYRANLDAAENALGSPPNWASYDETLAALESRLGPDHPDVANQLNSYGGALQEHGEYGEALRRYSRALAIWEHSLGHEDRRVGMVLNNIGSVLMDQGRIAEALPRLERALAVLEATQGPEHPWVAHPLTELGEAHLTLGDPERALPLLERALPIRREQGDPALLAETCFALARVLEALGGDPERTRELAQEALAGYRQAGDLHRDEAAAVEHWLAEAVPPRLAESG